MKLIKKWDIDRNEESKYFLRVKFSVFYNEFFKKLKDLDKEELYESIKSRFSTTSQKTEFLIPALVLQSSQRFNNSDILKQIQFIEKQECNREQLFVLYSLIYFCFYNYSLNDSLEVTKNIYKDGEKSGIFSGNINFEITMEDCNPNNFIEMILGILNEGKTLSEIEKISLNYDIKIMIQYIMKLAISREIIDSEYDEKYKKGFLKYEKFCLSRRGIK